MGQNHSQEIRFSMGWGSYNILTVWQLSLVKTKHHNFIVHIASVVSLKQVKSVLMRIILNNIPSFRGCSGSTSG